MCTWTQYDAIGEQVVKYGFKKKCVHGLNMMVGEYENQSLHHHIEPKGIDK